MQFIHYIHNVLGDYCDKDVFYVLKFIDFSQDCQKIVDFVNNVGQTGGGDAPECYEYALWTAAHKLNWSPESKSRAFVLIGYDPPSFVDVL